MGAEVPDGGTVGALSGKREPSLHTLLLLAAGLEIRLGDVLNELQDGL